MKQYTVEYASVPQRWGVSTLNHLPDHDELDATQRSEKCSQLPCVACGWKVKVDMFDPDGAVEGLERCLYMSVFVPTAEKSEALPMVFHVHHGQMLYGFKTEVGEVKKVAQQGIAVSNANFRLGAFGFLAHPDLEQVNVGQQDLIHSLTWLRQYACQFGANPGRVMLTGSSTGAYQAFMLVASTAATGLFQSVWIHSVPSVALPMLFSDGVWPTFENYIKPMMLKIGCGTLSCMREMPEKRLLLNLADVDSMLVRLNLNKMGDDAKSPFAYDGLVIPNMLSVGCNGFLANGNLPIVIGMAKDELDTLKFQFPLKTMLRQLVKDSLANTSLDTPERVECAQRKFLGAQGIQESAEDMMFGLGSYAIGTKFANQGSGPRWNFLLTAPASATKRSWHTSVELLTWSPNMNEDSDQYDHLTKDFVLRNAMPELRHYVHDNYLHFIKTGRPQDQGWMETVPVQDGQLGGLPTKVWDQKPLSGGHHWEYHHSNLTMKTLYGLACKNPNVLTGGPLDLKSCEHPTPPSPLDYLKEFRQDLQVSKKSDFLFNIEMLKAHGLTRLIDKAAEAR